jgi:hypothetical protein
VFDFGLRAGDPARHPTGATTRPRRSGDHPARRADHRAVGRIAANATQATLPAVLTDRPTRVLNLAVALNTGTVIIHRGSFIRTL